MSPVYPLVTSDDSLFSFYDIESLANVFTLCSYTPHPDSSAGLDIFFLLDDPDLSAELISNLPALRQMILETNPGLPEAVGMRVHNLGTTKGAGHLAALMGMSDAENVADPRSWSHYDRAFRPVCDTDPGYDPAVHPFLVGYNSLNYDTVMLAKFFAESFPTPQFTTTTAAALRAHNDALFSQYIDYMPGYLGWKDTAAKFRRSMILSGRHVDAARLNEHQQKVSLKRLLGMLGYQIKESSHLSHDTTITSIAQMLELIAYNVSDCLGLSQLFGHPTYSGGFDLKAGLLHQYPETVYAKDGSVRLDRLTIDNSSAKFVGRILAPWGPLGDIESVSFDYPHPDVAAEIGVPVVNVLDECVRFFEERVAPDPAANPHVTDAQRSAHAQFMAVVDYYRDIEGRNFNDSEEYHDAFDLSVDVLKSLPKTPNNVPYFLPDASPSSCFATFSTGGIHGAEADTASFHEDESAYLAQIAMIETARGRYPDPRDFVAEAKRQHNLLVLPDGSTVDKRLVLLGSDPSKVKFRRPKADDLEQSAQLARALDAGIAPADLLATQRPADEALDVVLEDGTSLVGKTVLSNTTAAKAAYRDTAALAEERPCLFKRPSKKPDDMSTKLSPKYAFTSAGHVSHEDFTSYYPNLLRNMRAFYNPELGEDRYAQIFEDKQRYGRMMKDPSLPKAEKDRLSTLRNGTKLILNSASGAGDTSFGRSPIRMNNRIVSMRIIGQLFSWRIGQAQTLAEAKIVSTNTDGLYAMGDRDVNERVLLQESAAINVEIEPEPLFLVSKDSNNRMEVRPPRDRPDALVQEWEIVGASGGTLACFKGPSPTKSLAHPAITDYALARYLRDVAACGQDALSEPFDPVLGERIVRSAIDPRKPVETLTFFQNVIAASRGSITYPFAAEPLAPSAESGASELVGPRPLQAVNRVFVVVPGTPGAVSLHNAGAWKVNPASQAKRRADGLQGVVRDPVAAEILRHHGWATSRLEASRGDGLVVVPDDQDVAVRKISAIDPAWSMLVVNDDLHTLSLEHQLTIVSRLDIGVYVSMLGETYEKNWRNAART